MADNDLILAVIRAQQGDTRAFDTLVRQFQNSAVAYARTLLRDPVAAEDAAQEAFVQAWRDLPRLSEAAAFGSWLRRLVFKFCDRIRRSTRLTVPLTDTLALPESEEPPQVVERADEGTRVRIAIDELPCPLREATILYYLTGHNIKEIADFLEMPPSTVKNRLYAARKRLRKELWTMAETMFAQEKPSNHETFAGNVLARVLREFQHQEAKDPHTANRGLLEEGRIALFNMLGKDMPLERQAIRDGFTLLWRKRDWSPLSALLMRYLHQSLSDSETTWAYLHLANAIAISGSAAGAVLAHEAFERWLPGKSPCLSSEWPYYPVSENTSTPVYAGEDVRLLFLAQSADFTKSYLGVWRNSDYLNKVDTALAEIPITSTNRGYRFFVLRMASNVCEAAEDLDGSQRYIQQMHVLAAGAEDETFKAELHARALGHEIRLAHRRQDEVAFMTHVTEMSALLTVAVSSGAIQAGWLQGQRHDLAHHLTQSRHYALALPLWEAIAETGGQVNGWGWLLYAATLWQVTGDRTRTLALLREARAHDDRDMALLFAERPEFAGVQEDLEFLQAVAGK